MIRYANASLVATKSPERRTVKLSFALDSSAFLHTISFRTTQRGREYLTNISPEELAAWPQHQLIHQQWRDEKRIRWIGKGLKHQPYVPGKIASNIRIEQTGAILIYDEATDVFDFQAWFDDMTVKILLCPNNNRHFPYWGEYKSIITEKTIKGEWR